MKYYQFVSFGEHGFQTHRFEIQDETEEQLLGLALQFCEQEGWTLIAGTVLGGEDPLPGLKASLGRAARDLGAIEIDGNEAIEALASISLLELTPAQVESLKKGVAINPDGTPLSEDQDVLVVQMLPVWWNTTDPEDEAGDGDDGDEVERAVCESPETADRIHVRMTGGWEWDNQVGPYWLEFGGRAYRVPDELVVEHVG